MSTSSNRRLAGWVIVDGHPYGPDHDLPEHIAVRITNPAAWPPGTRPTDTARGGPPAPVTPDADVPNHPPAGRDGTISPAPLTPDTAVPTDSRDTPASPDTAPASPAPAALAMAVPPPRSGKGSGVEAWRAYARAVHAAVPDSAERADIITACVNAGHLPQQ